MFRSLIISILLSGTFIFTSLIIPFLVTLFTSFSFKVAAQVIINLINITGRKTLCITFIVNVIIFFLITQIYATFNITEFPLIDMGLSFLMLFLILTYSFVLSPVLSIKLNKKLIYNEEYSKYLLGEFNTKISVSIVDTDLKNAYATGILPCYKIILLGRALIEGLSEQEIKGIILHEYAHNKYNHIFKIYLVSIAGIFLNFILIYFLSKIPINIPEVLKYALFGGFCGFINFQLLPGIFKKKFEYQADSFAARHIGLKTYEETLIHLDEVTGGLLKKGNASHPDLDNRIKNIYSNNEAR